VSWRFEFERPSLAEEAAHKYSYRRDAVYFLVHGYDTNVVMLIGIVL